jgi:hypothetical protein
MFIFLKISDLDLFSELAELLPKRAFRGCFTAFGTKFTSRLDPLYLLLPSAEFPSKVVEFRSPDLLFAHIANLLLLLLCENFLPLSLSLSLSRSPRAP